MFEYLGICPPFTTLVMMYFAVCTMLSFAWLWNWLLVVPHAEHRWILKKAVGFMLAAWVPFVLFAAVRLTLGDLSCPEIRETLTFP